MNDYVNVGIEIINSKKIVKTLAELSVDIGESCCTNSPAPAISGAVKAAVSIVGEIRSIPDIIFWNKFARFLQGTFRNEEYKTKFIEKFKKMNHGLENDDNYSNIKRLMMLLDSITADTKIDYCANLTRSYCKNNLDGPLYFKLFNLVNVIDEYTLKSICNYDKGEENDLDIVISTLVLHGIFEPARKSSKYKLSSLGKMLLNHSLQYEDEKYEQCEHCDKYTDLPPLNHDSSPMSRDEDGNITLKG